MKRIKKKLQNMDVLSWLGRTLSIVFGVVLISYFIEDLQVKSLASFSTNELIDTLFFPIGVLAGFVISWRNEFYGSLISILSLILFVVSNYITTGNIPNMTSLLLFNLPGFIFFISGLKKRRKREAHYIHNVR